MFGSASTALQLETLFLASLAPPMLARAVPRKINFPVHRFARAVSAVRNFLFKEIFKGCCLLFSYQGSCRSFQATACIDYHSALLLSRTFFIRFRHLFSSARHFSDGLLPSPGRSASASPVSRLSEVFLRHQRQVLSYHPGRELSTFFLFFIYFRQFMQF